MKRNPLTDAQRAALHVHLDAVLFAWASCSEGSLENTLSDYIDRLAERVGLSDHEKDRLVDAACERTNRLCPLGVVQEALAEIEDVS